MNKKVFISYHHLREQNNKDNLSKIIKKLNFFLTNDYILDKSIITEDIDDTGLPDKEIYKIIREQYLKETDITIVILGQHTKCRKYIDKEIGSSLTRYGSLNRRKKPNALIVLLTDDFIKSSKEHNNKNQNYNLLITLENAGERIYKNVINNYAVVDTINNVFLKPNYLITLIQKALLSSTTNKPNTEVSFLTHNVEDCSKFNKNNERWNEINKSSKSINFNRTNSNFFL